MYNVLWIFLIYSFVGWSCEVIYAALCLGKFVNRGFLFGPVCPIYGFGVLTAVIALSPFEDNLIILFAGSVIFTSTLEFITGFILEKFFHQKWWDYSDTPFNIKGYICLKFSILWGLACTFVIRLVHPSIMNIVGVIPKLLGTILLSLFYAAMLADFVLTLIGILKLPKKFSAMREIESTLEAISCRIGENLSEKTLSIKEKGSELKERGYEINEELRQKLDSSSKEELEKLLLELKEKHRRLSEHHSATQARLFKAFPNLNIRKR